MNKRLSFYLSVALIVLSLGLTGVFRLQQAKIDQQTEITAKKLSNRRKKLDTIKRERAKRNMNSSLKSTNPNIKGSAQQQSALNDLNNTTQKFFKVVMTANSREEFAARKNEVSDIATQDVLNNKDLFNSGNDSTGHSIIGALHLHFKFDSVTVYGSSVNDDGTITGNVIVYYDTWQGDNDPATVADVYQVSYDTHQKKLTSVSRVANLAVTSTND